MMIWKHDVLAEDLVGYLKAPDRMVWADMQLGRQGSPRPDVYTINKSYVHPCPTAYECKISVSDFRADVTSGKWSAYLKYAHSVVFAVPVGLISKQDVPDMCGLIIRHENVWRMAKRATVNPSQIDQEALLKLLIDGVEREGPQQRSRWWKNQDVTSRFAQRFGSTAARYVSDAAEIHKRLERAEYDSQRIMDRAQQQANDLKRRAEEEAPEKWAELLDVLGLKTDASRWSVDAAIRRLREGRSGSVEGRALRGIITQLENIIRKNEAIISDMESRVDAEASA